LHPHYPAKSAETRMKAEKSQRPVRGLSGEYGLFRRRMIAQMGKDLA